MRRALCFAGALALAACSSEERVNEEHVHEKSSPIIGGSADAADPAIVMLVSYPADMSTFETCTATLIAPTVLLTAAHCVDPATHTGESFGVFTGPDANAYATAAEIVPTLVAVASVHAHPKYDSNAPFTADIGVAILTAPLATTPLEVNRAPLDAKLVGAAARIVGYGQTVYGDFNAKKFEATTAVVSIEKDDTIIVGDATRRSCIGDSGGPALVKIAGVEKIVGIDSYTDLKGCLDPAYYRRPDLYTAFLDQYAPPPMPDGGAGGGGAGGGAASSSSSSSSGAAVTTGGDAAPASSGGCALAGPEPTSAPIPLALFAVFALSAAALRRRRVS